MKNALAISPINVEERKKLDVRAGDTIKVWSKIQEKGKIRLQAYEGLVLARKHGTEAGATITVRKVSNGIGVERIFPLYSPNIDKIEILKRAEVRKSKLYYIREKVAKEIRRRMKQAAYVGPTNTDDGEDMPEEVVAEETKEEVKEAKTE